MDTKIEIRLSTEDLRLLDKYRRSATREEFLVALLRMATTGDVHLFSPFQLEDPRQEIAGDQPQPAPS